MKAKLIYPGHELWTVWCNQVCPEYNYTVILYSDQDINEESPLDLIDTHTKAAARTLLDAVNLGIVTDWRQLYD